MFKTYTDLYHIYTTHFEKRTNNSPTLCPFSQLTEVYVGRSAPRTAGGLFPALHALAVHPPGAFAWHGWRDVGEVKGCVEVACREKPHGWWLGGDVTCPKVRCAPPAIQKTPPGGPNNTMPC